VAEVLAGDRTWTALASHPASNWHTTTPSRTEDIADTLGGIADQLGTRAAAILAPPPAVPPDTGGHHEHRTQVSIAPGIHRPTTAVPLRHRHYRQVARAIAAALQVRVDQVTVTDDPLRYDGELDVPRDLISVTDGDAVRWFIPDPTARAGARWLLLGECYGCGACRVPVARIATAADLAACLDPANQDAAVEFWENRHDDGECDCTTRDDDDITDADEVFSPTPDVGAR
jgi:hypothetical protein